MSIMAELNYWNVDTTDPYIWVGLQCVSIEEVGDEFYSEEELKEITGRSYIHERFTHVFKEKIKAELFSWKEKLVASGEKSIICTDAHLVESICGVNDDVWKEVGLSRRGNMFYIKKPTKKKVYPCKQDFQTLIEVVTRGIFKKHQVCLKVERVATNQCNGLNLLKKLIEWDELEMVVSKWGHTENVGYGLSQYDLSDETIAKMKMILQKGKAPLLTNN
jgi:hypothetical protein